MNNSSSIISKAAKKILRCEFLPSHNVVVDCRSVVYYPVSGVLTKTVLESLISIAERYELHYFVFSDFNGIAFRMYFPQNYF